MILAKKLSLPLMVLALFTISLCACRRTPDEVQLRQTIAAVAAAAEEGESANLVASVSDDFDGNQGEFDRHSLGDLLRVMSLRQDHVGVTLGPITIERRGERMLASFTVTLTRGDKLLPDQLGVYKVESAWRREGNHWLCYSASWKQAI